MKRMTFLVLAAILAALPAPRSSFAQKEFEDFFDSADEEFKKLKQKTDEEFAELKKSVDDEFGELLRNAWREFELSRGLVRDTTPKPPAPPVAEPRPKPVKPPAEEKAPLQHPEKEPEAPPAGKPPVSEKTTATIPPAAVKPRKPVRGFGEPLSFTFYDVELTLTYDRRWKVNLLDNEISPDTISKYWDFFNKTDYESFLDQVSYIRKRLGLNDWGYCRLLNTASAAIYGRETNERPLFIWFMLVKSGFDARIGFNEHKVFVLIPSDQVVYQAPFYEFEGEKYYITSLGRPGESIKSMFAYEGKHPAATRKIDFTLVSPPLIGKKTIRRTLTFRFADREYEIPVVLNENMITFLDNYPQTNLDIYFQSAVSGETETSLMESLRELIRGKREEEAVNILLRFVQTSFAYKTDEEQFGEENYLFPEESIYYPYCDCEDRSFLFSHLVTRLLGLEVIGLQYPGHVATAVRFNTNVQGDYVIYRKERYVICDPTYINAVCGQCMPRYRNVTPEVIPVSGQGGLSGGSSE